MISPNKYSQYGRYGLKIKGITIHNTGSQYSARELFNYLNGNCDNSSGCHFLVDKDEVIQVMPLNWKVYHTGKGNDMAFNYTIAIEICNSTDDEETYLRAQDRAIVLIKDLMERYNLTTKDIYFHVDFNNNYYCPHRILQMYKTKERFIKEVFYGNSDIG